MYVRGNLFFFACFLFGDARAEDFRLGLEIDDEIRLRKLDGEGLVIALIELQFGIIEIEIGEDAVLFHQVVGDDRARSVAGKGFADAFLALHQKIELSVESGAGFFVVEIGQERIVLAIIDAAGMKPFGEDTGQGGLADPQEVLQ